MPTSHYSFTTIILISLLSVAVVGLGYNYFYRPIWNRWQAEQLAAQPPAPRQAASDAGTLQNGLAQSLSTQEKITQLLVVPVATVPQGSASAQSAQLEAATVSWLQTYQPGFVQLVGAKLGGTASSPSASAKLQPLSLATALATTQALDVTTAGFTWPVITLVRHSSGDGQVLRGVDFTTLPTMAQLCASMGKATATTTEATLAASAQEVAELDIGIVIGPVVDLQSATGFQGSQICSDPIAVVGAAKKYIENFGQAGVMPVVAHFPGIGQAQRSPQRELQTLPVTVSELKPFQELLTAYPNIGVLTSAVKVTGKFAGQPCVFSAECLAAFKQDYPQALVIAELPAGPVGPVAQTGGSASASLATQIKQSLVAGNHLVIVDQQTSLAALTTAVQQLTADYETDPALEQAVTAGLTHVLLFRAGNK